jgi:hypothetical protein
MQPSTRSKGHPAVYLVQTILCPMWLSIPTRQQVAALLPIVLPTNQLAINTVAAVANFQDLSCISYAFSRRIRFGPDSSSLNACNYFVLRQFALAVLCIPGSGEIVRI